VASTASGEEDQAPWPQAIIDRPCTLPVRSWSAAIDAQSDFKFHNVSLGVGGFWGLSYGFTNDFTAGVSYLAIVAANDGSKPGTGPLLANAALVLYVQGPLEITAMGSAGYGFDQRQVAPLVLGVATPWNVLPWMSIGLNGNQFSFGLASPWDVTFSFPLQVAFQPWPFLWARININAFNLNIRNSENKSFVTVQDFAAGPGLVYSPTNQWDLQAGTTMNPVPAGRETFATALEWTLSVTYYGNVPNND
jgi:hypothetical protein